MPSRRSSQLATPLAILPAAILLAACANIDRAIDDVDAGFRSTVDDVRAAFARTDEADAQKAAGDAARDVALARRYMAGDGVPRDPDRAVALLRPHARDGHAGAQYELGLALMRGDGVAQDTDEAARWFDASAKQGNRRAQYHLALGYAGAGKDEEALAWFESAADRGHAEAQYMTGEFYHLGRGTPRDRAWAARWFGKAAARGVAQAQYMLGLAYAAPSGLPRDLEAAYRWLSLAARHGEERAVKYRDGLAEKLSADARRRADIAVARWQPAAATNGSTIDDTPTVVFVQYALAQSGFAPGPVDGLMGPRTRDAILDYRKERRVGTGPVVTDDLLASLRHEGAASDG